MNKELIISMKNTFDNIVHIDSEIGIEFWYARELQAVLGYTEWRNFTNVIDKAKEACKTTTHALSNHFVDVNKMVNIGSCTVRETLF